MARLLPGFAPPWTVTQGATEEDAVKNINEVVRIIVDELQEDGSPLPVAPPDEIDVVKGARVAVTV